MILDQRTSNNSLLIMSIGIYILIIIIMLFFIRKIFIELFMNVQNVVIYLVFGIICIIILVIIIAIIIYWLYVGYKKKQVGNNFQTMLLGMFLLVASLISIPQIIMYQLFMHYTLESLFPRDTVVVQKNVLGYVIRYQNEQEGFLTHIIKSSYVNNALELRYGFEGLWDTIITFNPSIDAMHVLSSDKELIFGNPSLLPHYSDNYPNNVVLRETRDSGETILFIRKKHGENSIVLSLVLPHNFENNAALLAELNQRDMLFQTAFRDTQVSIVWLLFLFGIPLFLIGFVLSFLFSYDFAYPMHYLELATYKAAQGKFDFRITALSNKAYKFLFYAFNDMMQELEFSLHHAQNIERIATWQDIARRLAHEIKNPLTPMRLSVERLMRKYKPQGDIDEFVPILEKSGRLILREIDAITHMLTEFTQFARLAKPNLRYMNISEILIDACDAYSETSRIIFGRSIEPNVMVYADEQQLYQVFHNIIQNAIDAIHETQQKSGAIYISLVRIERTHLSYCQIQVYDNGIGIAAKDIAEIFTPYMTHKKHGTGLGLAIIKRIIIEHRGSIWCESMQGLGSSFFIEVPCEKHEDDSILNSM